MIFKVERLGPVNRAEIDLSKDLILLTGPNGTGKTYVAWAVYGLLITWQGPSLIELLSDIIRPVADRLLASGSSEFDLAATLWELGDQITSQVARTFSERIADDFAATKQVFEATSIQLDSRDIVWRWRLDTLHFSVQTASEWTIGFRSKANSLTFLLDVTKKDEPPIPLGALSPAARDSVREPLLQALRVSVLFSSPHPNPMIFPAERIATTIFSRELSLKRTDLVDQMLAMQSQSEKVMGDYLRSHAQRYPRPIRDSLQMAGDLEHWSRNQSEFTDLADYLEQRLLRGKVRLSQYGNLEFVPDQRSDIALGMHITASVVKSLSLLVFYFRHMAQKGDFVIIDEPELNLHPDNQRLIARVLARAVNRGLKVMASTHSDYLVRELNNLIMLGQDTEPVKALRQKHGYEEAELLKPSQLGVYLFRDNTAEPVPVDETGFSIATIDAEIDRLNAVSQEIYATLFEQEPE